MPTYAELTAQFRDIKRRADLACQACQRASGDPDAETLADAFDALLDELDRISDAMAAHPDCPKTWLPVW